jgi:hypothetical protein
MFIVSSTVQGTNCEGDICFEIWSLMYNFDFILAFQTNPLLKATWPPGTSWCVRGCFTVL